MAMDDLIARPVRHLFFTGKGGVGKTSLSCAAAISLSARGLRILLVSTDPASNLDEMLATPLTDMARPVNGVEGLFAMNIDPEAAAEAYRHRVLAQMGPEADDEEKKLVREQLSGACTTEIAAFDVFVDLITGDQGSYDRIIFDTAPTGHTLRLLSLPKAWSGFLADNDRGASCLGPHSGLQMQEAKFRAALEALSDPAQTAIVLVSRPESAALKEAARSSGELSALGLGNQVLAINGLFRAENSADRLAAAVEREQQAALSQMPRALAALPVSYFPLLAFDMVGLAALRAIAGLETVKPSLLPIEKALPAPVLGSMPDLVDGLALSGHGLVMVMGKGGVGKTTLAAAIAIGLARRGHKVHLTTTDPAAHLGLVLDEPVPELTVDRIDPVLETSRYIDKVMATKGKTLDAEARALLREDLASPCTEEVAVFHAFARVVAQARDSFVVVDTAPTGHTLLLLDATGAYHRQVTRHLDAEQPGHLVTPLMRLQDPDYTQILLVTLAETTPISEAASLQDDLRRAGIEPYGWVVNKALSGTPTADPLLLARQRAESGRLDRVITLARRTYLLAYQTEPPVGSQALAHLV